MSLLDQVPVHNLKCNLRPFQVLGVFYIFWVKVMTLSRGMLADDMVLERWDIFYYSNSFADWINRLCNA